MARYKPLQSFSGPHGSFAPGDTIDEDSLSPEAKAADVITDWLRAGFIEPVKAASEKAAAPVVTEQAVVPPAEPPVAPAVEEHKGKKGKGKG